MKVQNIAAGSKVATATDGISDAADAVDVLAAVAAVETAAMAASCRLRNTLRRTAAKSNPMNRPPPRDTSRSFSLENRWQDSRSSPGLPNLRRLPLRRLIRLRRQQPKRELQLKRTKPSHVIGNLAHHPSRKFDLRLWRGVPSGRHRPYRAFSRSPAKILPNGATKSLLRPNRRRNLRNRVPKLLLQ